MSTRIALIVSFVSIMFTLVVATHAKEQNVYMAATAVTSRNETLEIDQRASATRVVTRLEQKSRLQSRGSQSRR